MQFVRTEVRVWRIVLIHPTHSRVAKQHAPTAIRLQPVLVWVDDDRVGGADRVEGSSGLHSQVSGEREITAIGGIHVQSKFKTLRNAMTSSN